MDGSRELSSAAGRPVPTPRSRAKGKTTQDQPSTLGKSELPAKPKIAPKPSVPDKSTAPVSSTSGNATAQVSPTDTSSPGAITLRTKDNPTSSSLGKNVKAGSRPLSVKVTNDGVHNKVAGELASILGRPRSTSKGLLSPTAYSAEQQGSSLTPGTDHPPLGTCCFSACIPSSILQCLNVKNKILYMTVKSQKPV